MSKGKKVSSLILILAMVLAVVIVPEVIYYKSHINKSGGLGYVADIGGKRINLEIVTTTQAMAIGLSNRDYLDADKGMLFIYNKRIMPGFWMKDMRFPIDIIWISGDRIVGAQENAPVTTTGPLPVYYPSEPVSLVLEVNAGFVEANDIKAGDRVNFKSLK